MSRFSHRQTGFLCMVAVTLLTLGTALPPATAEPILYTMTWNSVSGTYANTGFTNQQMTMKFLGDTDAIVENNPNSASITFANGQGVTVSIGGTVLSDALLDDLSTNTSTLFTLQASNAVFLQSQVSDRGNVAVLTGVPATGYDMLATAWYSAGNAAISQGWITGETGFVPLTISGQTLYFGSIQGGAGSWGVAVVPEPAAFAVALAGLACCRWATRRRPSPRA